jgi:hypothetical protein
VDILGLVLDICDSPKRTVIRREFIHIWERNIEFDNFTPEEIAAALTLTAQGRYQFTSEEVAKALAAFGRKGDPISSLFATKVQYGLPKPELLCHLIDLLPLEEPATLKRPLLVLVDQIVEIAALNHKPTFIDTWFENQESGYLGHPIDGAGRMADAFEELRAIQSHLDATATRSSEGPKRCQLSRRKPGPVLWGGGTATGAGVRTASRVVIPRRARKHRCALSQAASVSTDFAS